MKIKKKYLKGHHMKEEARAFILQEGATVHINGIPCLVLSDTFIATHRGNSVEIGGLYIEDTNFKVFI